MKRKMVIFGGSGLLGGVIAQFFSSDYEIVIVSRNSPNFDCDRFCSWNAKTFGSWVDELNGADVVINMTGRSVDCRYTKENKRLIMESRVDSTNVIGQAIARCPNPPKVWLNSSTATIYKHSLDVEMDEGGETGATPEAKDEFSIEVARAWEKTLYEAKTPATRKVALRTAMVLSSREGGVFHVLRRLVKFGLGGKMSTGKQFVSWVHEQDFCRAIEWIINHDDLSGHVNIASPDPVTNADMMKIFREIYHVPLGLPASRWMLEIGAVFLGTETELILKSRRVVPGLLKSDGFQLNFPKLDQALRDIESRL